MPLILIASVGGATAPVASAVAAKQPDHVVFVASAAQGAQPGTASLVPNILAQAQRPRQSHEILQVPPDDPEAIFLALRQRLAVLRQEKPGATFLFDYTGGTKSMTGALFQAAIATEKAKVQFMGGRRENLDRITDGTERPVSIATAWLIAERTEQRLRAAWKGFDYATAAAGFMALHDDLGGDAKAPEELRRRLVDLAEVSRAFDLWDRFRHAEAADHLRELTTRQLAPWAERARRCASEEPLRLMDLWQNARRCAARGRYDDAVARLYRLTEWISQWWLLYRHGLDTGKMDWSRVTPQEAARADLEEAMGKNKQTTSGLMQNWMLIAAKETDGPVARFLARRFHSKDPKETCEERLKDVVKLRNKSILAHGQRPLSKENWDKWFAFAEEMRKAVLVPLLRAAGMPHELPPQLPDNPADLGL